MAISNLHINFTIWLRWVHVLAGIFWIGQLYFLDFVYLPLLWSLDDSHDDSHDDSALRRLTRSGAWWLRWSAMTSAVSGVFLFVTSYFYIPGAGFEATPLLISDGGLTERSLWILFGMALALVMWFNIWFVVWPAQKQLLLTDDTTPDLAPLLRRRSALAVRTNTLLSGPMLFAMLAPSHYGSIDISTWLLVIAIGVLAMVCLSKIAGTINARTK